MPGGGFANLELYERLGSSSDVNVVTILGEGSFHQMHGGTTTNLSGSDARHDTLASYTEHFKELRGRDFMGHRKRLHYVGTMFDEAARTRARRRIAPRSSRKPPNGAPTYPTQPMPIPQELTAQYLEAYWQSLAWRETTWLGVRVPRPPTDLFAYQELVAKLRPDWIIDIRAGVRWAGLVPRDAVRSARKRSGHRYREQGSSETPAPRPPALHHRRSRSTMRSSTKCIPSSAAPATRW